MQNILSQSAHIVDEENKAVGNFLKQFQVSALLRNCNAYKKKGVPVIQLLTYLLCLMFSPVSTYMSMRIGSFKETFSKNTIRRFCNDGRINWHKFLRLLSLNVARDAIDPATSGNRENYFIIDDTPYAKFGKKTELVSKFFNHVNMTYEFGYRILTMIWSDGYSNVPVDFVPLSSSNDKLVRTPAKDVDKRTIAGKNRKMSRMPAPELIKIMIQQAFAAGHKADYVLFDSWFSTPKGIMDIVECFEGLHVIAMIKKSGKVYYEYNGGQLNVKQIFSRNKKRRGRSKYLLSVDVNLLQKEKGNVRKRIPARIVFVRNKSNKKEWIAIISTNTELTPEEIIRKYGYRWNIECMFKTCKQYLKLCKECNSPSFDSLTSHLAMVFVRYMMLVVYERKNSDERSLGELFWLYAEEVAEITFSRSMELIFLAFIDTAREFFTLSDEQMSLFVQQFMGRLPQWLQTAMAPCIAALG